MKTGKKSLLRDLFKANGFIVIFVNEDLRRGDPLINIFGEIPQFLLLMFHKLRGFLHCLVSLSIVPFTRSILVSSLFAVMIHSMYSFLFVKERALKKPSCFLFFLRAIARSSGNFTVFVCGST